VRVKPQPLAAFSFFRTTANSMFTAPSEVVVYEIVLSTESDGFHPPLQGGELARCFYGG